MNLSEAWIYFASRSEMLPTVKHNFKNKPEYLCACKEPDVQAHLVDCPSYSHFRQRLRVKELDKDLVRFYQLVIQERSEDI